MSDVKINRVNRNFTIKVHLYYDASSKNRDSDSNPRFYLKPVSLLNVEKVAFTDDGGRKNNYTKYGNRFWKWKSDDTLSDAQVEAIYNKIKDNYPYGHIENDLATENKYILDVKENKAFQSFYKTYWENHADEIKQPKTVHEEQKDYPHPYISFISNEIITYKYTVGDVPVVPIQTDLAYDYVSGINNYYAQPQDYSCNSDEISVSVVGSVSGVTGFNNYFVTEGFYEYPLKLKASGRHRFDLWSGDDHYGGATWPTGVDGNYSGFRFRFSTGLEGTLAGFNDYTDGISYHEGPEIGNYYVKVLTKTPASTPGDDYHPYIDTGSSLGYALSGSGGTATGVNSGAYSLGYDEGPVITLRRESTYYFNQQNASNEGHPIYISTDPSGAGSDVYTSGVSHFPQDRKYISGGQYFTTFEVPYNAPNTLYYSCENHTYMGGKINIIDSPAPTGSGRIPGESIVLNSTGTGDFVLRYYSPEGSGMGGLALMKKDCGASAMFGT
jgi:hypothetical protein